MVLFLCRYKEAKFLRVLWVVFVYFVDVRPGLSLAASKHKVDDGSKAANGRRNVKHVLVALASTLEYIIARSIIRKKFC